MQSCASGGWKCVSLGLGKGVFDKELWGSKREVNTVLSRLCVCLSTPFGNLPGISNVTWLQRAAPPATSSYPSLCHFSKWYHHQPGCCGSPFDLSAFTHVPTPRSSVKPLAPPARCLKSDVFTVPLSAMVHYLSSSEMAVVASIDSGSHFPPEVHLTSSQPLLWICLCT